MIITSESRLQANPCDQSRSKHNSRELRKHMVSSPKFSSSYLTWFYLKSQSCATLFGRASHPGGDEAAPWVFRDPQICNRSQHIGGEKLIVLSSVFSIPSTRHYSFYIRNQYVAQGEVKEKIHLSSVKADPALGSQMPFPPSLPRVKWWKWESLGELSAHWCCSVTPISNICNAFPIPAASQVTPCNYIPNCDTVVLSGMLHRCLIYKCQFGSTIQWEITHIRHRAVPTYE